MARFRLFLHPLYLTIFLSSSQFIVDNVEGLIMSSPEILCDEWAWVMDKGMPKWMPGIKPYATFFLSTKTNPELVKIGVSRKYYFFKEYHWDTLINSRFNVSHPTIVITHGYLSSRKELWIQTFVNKLHEIRNANIIVIDWSFTAQQINYCQVAMQTPRIAEKVIKFFRTLRIQVAKKLPPAVDYQWNKLYFIGHSLGAHVCGQTAHLLKETNPFWHITRITGLDPAKPCFVETLERYKLDKNDADFVDIIHSQIGEKQRDFSYGINQPLGHIDFYMDGGRDQPNCLKSSSIVTNAICSHRIACTYFAETLTNDETSPCALYGYKWDGQRDSALKMLHQGLLIKELCQECPQVGINSIQSKARGQFLVLTFLPKPYCSTYDSPEWVTTAVEELSNGASFH